MISYNEKNIVISEIHAPDTFSEAFLFADNNKLLINIIADTDVKILVIYKEDFFKLLNKNRKILDNFLNITSNRFVIVTKKVKLLMIKTIKGKLANYILDLEKENKGNPGFKLGKTHKQLANLFGITRPALTRNLIKLKNDGLIEIENKKIKIINRERLMQLLEQKAITIAVCRLSNIFSTDVETETNELMTYDRKILKLNPGDAYKINTNQYVKQNTDNTDNTDKHE